MTSKRHAKPTSAQLTNRSYRKLITLQAQVLTIVEQLETLRSGQQMLSQRMDSIADSIALSRLHASSDTLETRCRIADLKPIVEHCARLLREKETLRKQLAAMQALKDSAAYMSEPLNKIPTLQTWSEQLRHSPLTECGFASTHRPGIRCFVCGVTP